VRDPSLVLTELRRLRRPLLAAPDARNGLTMPVGQVVSIRVRSQQRRRFVTIGATDVGTPATILPPPPWDWCERSPVRRNHRDLTRPAAKTPRQVRRRQTPGFRHLCDEVAGEVHRRTPPSTHAELATVGSNAPRVR